MTPEALTALQGSIAKWRAVVAGDLDPEDATAWTTCPLCVLFYDGGYCSNCPVKLKTGHSQCDQTPFDMYAAAVEACGDYDDPEDPNAKTMARAARAELAFLISLLPPSKDSAPC